MQAISDSSIESGRFLVAKYTLVNNRYVLLDEIGAGSYATVWLAFDYTNDTYCALKIALSQARVQSLRRERDVCNVFASDRVLSVVDAVGLDAGDTDDIHCIALPLMHDSLYSLRCVSVFSFEVILHVTKQILEGLVHIHERGYIHGDIKLENILVVQNIRNKPKSSDQQWLDDLALKPKPVSKGKKSKSKSKQVTAKHDAFMEHVGITNQSRSASSRAMSHSTQNTEISLHDRSFVVSVHGESDSIPDHDNEQIQTTIDCAFDIVISDFGWTSQSCSRHDIQTSYYKAPEMLMMLQYDTKIDVWSLGCVVVEMITSKLLFDVGGDADLPSMRNHLHVIDNIFGIPQTMIDACPIKSLIWAHASDARIKAGHRTIQQVGCYDKCKTINEVTSNTAAMINYALCAHPFVARLVQCMLVVDPNRRASAQECLDMIKAGSSATTVL